MKVNKMFNNGCRQDSTVSPKLPREAKPEETNNKKYLIETRAPSSRWPV